MGRLETLLNQLTSSAKERGDEFEHLCKWFLENDPIYATQLEKVWLWDEWPDRWGPDAGIDLVARTKQGELWAIQAKHYAPESTVSKADIDSFLSESSRPGFAFRLLIATTDRLSTNAKRTLDGQKVPAQALLRSQLVECELVWPDRIGQEPKRRKPHTPRPHQKAAIKDVTKGFTEADRGQLIMACGTGKTLTSLFIAEKLAAKRVLVLVPSLSLLSQTLSEWTANAKEPIEFLPVCSDATVAEKDAAVESTSELGFPVTTDPDEIATFVRRRGDTMRVVFATYQSSDRIEAAQKLSRVPKFDLVIADEAHRCTGNTTSDFATVLDAGKIRSDRRLFMTATPRILSARAKRSALDADVEFASMDDEDTFGPVFHRLTFATAIEQDLLADYQVVILGVDNEEVLKAVQECQLVTTNGKDIISADRLGAAVGLAKAIRKHGLTRLITFHGRVKAASNFADTFPAILDWMPPRQRPKGTTETNFVSGEMSAGERKRALHHLKTSEADQVILANARVLTEGIDVPDLDGVAFMDPRNSEVDIVQAVGRAIRKPLGKNKDKIGTIVLPIVIEQTDDAEEELARSDYKAVWAVLRALRAHDERLAEAVDELRRGLGRTARMGESSIPSRLIVDLPTRCTEGFVESLITRVIEASTSSWEENFGCLQAFVAEVGHAQPQQDVVHNGFALGRWVSQQRGDRETLSASRRRRLEDLSGWTWNFLESEWERKFALLQRFVAHFGDALVSDEEVFEGASLGHWVRIQRRAHRQNNLSDFRRSQLESLPGWAWSPRSAKWERGYLTMVRYSQEVGHARPARAEVFRSYPVGRWVRTQREFAERLTHQQRERLEALPGWSWGPREDAWQEKFRAALAFAEGLSEPVFGQVLLGVDPNLADWIYRHSQDREEVSEFRRQQLERIPGWQWGCERPARRGKSGRDQHDESLDWSWDEGFRCLQDFVVEFGHARPDGASQWKASSLGAWVAATRQRRGELSRSQRDQLEALPGWRWEVRGVRDANWERDFVRLVEFARLNGGASPAASATHDGFQIGYWVANQRAAQRRLGSDFDAYRRARLESLPGWKWDARVQD